MKGILPIIFVYLTITSFLHAEEANNDASNLKSQLVNSTTTNYDKAKVCLSLVEFYINSNIDSAHYFNQEAYKYFNLEFNGVDDLDTSYQRLQATILTNFGLISFNKGDFVEALSFHQKSQKLWEIIGDPFELGISYNNLAVIYKNARDYDKAFKLYQEGLKVLEATGNKTKIAMVHNNLANLYKETNDNDNALKHAIAARDLRLDPYDENGFASALNNLGSIYLKLNQLDSARINLILAQEIVQRNGHKMGLAFVQKNLAETYFAMNNLDSAKVVGESSLVLAYEVKNQVCINACAKLLAQVYKSKKQWDKAFEMEELFAQSSEELRLTELNSDLLKGEIQFEYDKQRILDQKEADKKLLKSEKQKAIQTLLLIAAVIIIVVILLFMRSLYKRNQMLKERNELIEEQNNERKFLLKEIHHRVKNNFQVTTSLLRLQSEKISDLAAKEAFESSINRLQAMSGVHETIYKNESFAEINHAKYIKKLVNQLQESFDNDKIEINLNIISRKGIIKHTVPLGIIINELITNSYKHAFHSDQLDPKIEIELAHANSEYKLIYKDNGTGFDLKEANESFGNELIAAMVEQLSGTIEYASEGQWKSHITIHFPE